MNPPLRELQRRFAAAVYSDATDVLTDIEPGLFADGIEARAAVQGCTGCGFGPARLLQVYRNNTNAGLTQALASVYPVVRRLVGEGFFAYAAHAFLRRHPPRTGHLHPFGSALAKFLADFEPARGHPYLPDVARLEWAWHEVFHEADSPPLDTRRLTAVPVEHHGELRFRLNPASRLIASNYPLLRIWQANQNDGDDLSQIDLTAGGERLLVLRPALDVEIEALGAGDYALLRALAAGATFADASGCALDAEPAYDLAGRLGHFVQRTAITDFNLA